MSSITASFVAAMQLTTWAPWARIPIVLWAAMAQTVRNASQRTLTASIGTLPATLVRFLYGLPFAAAMRAWKLSLLAGMMGAFASIGWFTAFALQPAADVRTLGLIEVLFSYLVSHRLFREKLSRTELAGLVLVTVGGIVVCARL